MRSLVCGIADVLFQEEAAHAMRLAWSAMQVAAQGMDEFALSVQPVSAKMTLDVVVEPFVGIEFGL